MVGEEWAPFHFQGQSQSFDVDKLVVLLLIAFYRFATILFVSLRFSPTNLFEELLPLEPEFRSP